MLELDTILRLSHVPTRERFADCLTETLFAVEEMLEMLRAEDAASLAWIETPLRNVSAELEGVMRRMCN